jgi:PAS domain S-box-containing protein
MSVETLTEREHLQTNYEAHYELLPYAVLVHAGGIYLYANAEARAMFGDVVGQSILVIVPPEMRETVARRANVVLTGRRTETIEQRLIGAGGRELYADVVGVPSVTPDGRPAALVIARDVSARHAMERRFRHLVEHGADLILVIDREGTIQFASQNARRVLGFAPEEMVGRPVFDFDHPDDVVQASAVFTEVLATPRGRGLTTLRCRHKNEGWRLLDVSAMNLLDDPSVAGLVINAHDVTERNRLGAEVAQLKRVESLGRVAASVAHELNNVLMTFQAVATRAERSGLDPELQGILKRALLRGKSVTSDILRFAQPAVATKERVSFAVWLTEAATDAESLLGKTHRVRLSLDEQLGYVSIDRHQLGQVLTNLVANARDAMPGGGTIEIAGRHSEDDHGEVCFTVTDRGTGIAEEMRERIFEPLFTTKSSGTGLGLPIVQQIVLHHGGRISVKSEEGVGTTFTVTLAQA